MTDSVEDSGVRGIFIIILLVAIVATVFAIKQHQENATLTNQLNTTKSQLSQITNKYNQITSANAQSLRKCIYDAQGLAVLDPYVYGGNFLPSSISGCQAEYPTQ